MKLCWLLPLVLGLAIFFTWLVTKNDFLMVFGVYDLYLGVCLSVFGLVYGSIRLFRTTKDPAERRGTLVLILLILSNLPVALGVLVTAMAVSTAYSVEISNNTSSDLSNCKISGGGIDEEIGILKTHTMTSRTFWIEQDGGLILSYTLRGVINEKPISGYVTNGMGGHDFVEIQYD